MADVQHSALTGASLHEPKGASGASADTVYVSDGAGSGSWVKIDSGNIDTTSIKNVNKFFISKTLADISTAEVVYIPVPLAGQIDKVVTVLQGAITAADATLTLKNSVGSSAGTITVAFSGSGIGDIDTLTPVSNNTFTADSYFTFETDGGSTTTAKLTVIFECSLT